jgi:hypothetical protein
MRKQKLGPAGVALLAFFGTVLSAQAATYNWSFNGLAVSGSGTLDTGAAEPGNGFLITGITGTWTDGLGTENILTLLPPGHFNSNDNILYPTSTPLLDSDGFAFSVAQEFVQISFGSVGTFMGYAFATFPAVGNCDAPGTTCLTGITAGSMFTFTSTTTPLPAALPLFATGLGALGLLGWRRKRKA